MKFCKVPLILLSLSVCAGCATPTTPGGGPPDQEGPRVVSTEPESGTTGFGGEEITFHFSEFVNRGSMQEALTLEPEVGIPWSLDWGRRSVTVELERPLPDSTTLIVTVGTDLADMNGNNLSNPVSVAVSSGPRIAEGSLVGRILNARTGRGSAGNRVLLYREPADLEGPAVYTAETDTSGRFSFHYLGAGDYRPIWADDRNRNKTWDRQQERAQPFAMETVTLGEGEADTLGTLYVAGADTTPPRLLGVGLFNAQRMRMRFSEEIVLHSETEIMIADTLGSRISGGFPLYLSPADPYILFARSGQRLSPDSTYRVEVRNVSDAAGNMRELSSYRSTGSGQADTTRQRIVGRDSGGGLYPDEPVVIRFAAPITDPQIRDSVKIVKGTEMVSGTEQSRVETNRLVISPQDQWEEGVEYEFRIWDPSTGGYRTVTPTIWREGDLGSLLVTVEDSTLAGPFRLRITHEERGVMADTTFKGETELERLPPLEYRLTVYQDANGNGSWDEGTADPFRAPEPYFVQSGIPVRGGFTGEVTVTFDNR